MTLNNQKTTRTDDLQNDLDLQTEHVDKLFNKIKVATVLEQLLLLLTGSAICYYILS